MITPTAQVFAQMRDNVLAAPDEESRLFAVAHREWRKFIKVRRKWPQHLRACQSTTANAHADTNHGDTTHQRVRSAPVGMDDASDSDDGHAKQATNPSAPTNYAEFTSFLKRLLLGETRTSPHVRDRARVLRDALTSPPLAQLHSDSEHCCPPRMGRWAMQ